MRKISATYTDLNNTSFPDSVDEHPKYQDPSTSDLPLIAQYNALYASGKIDEATAILDANPRLKTMIVSAANLNNLRDGQIAIERWYKTNFEDYLQNHVKQICTSTEKPTNQVVNDIWQKIIG